MSSTIRKKLNCRIERSRDAIISGFQKVLDSARNDIGAILTILFVPLMLQSCIINNPSLETSVSKTIIVDSIYEGGVKDIVFSEANGDFYYINRGLENGLTIKEIEAQVLNKSVNLHLANTIWGNSTPHITQLAIQDSIIYTEFD